MKTGWEVSWDVLCCFLFLQLHPPPSAPALCPGRLTGMGGVNGLSCCLVSGWVWPMGVIDRRWERGRRVKLEH